MADSQNKTGKKVVSENEERDRRAARRSLVKENMEVEDSPSDIKLFNQAKDTPSNATVLFNHTTDLFSNATNLLADGSVEVWLNLCLSKSGSTELFHKLSLLGE